MEPFVGLATWGTLCGGYRHRIHCVTVTFIMPFKKESLDVLIPIPTTASAATVFGWAVDGVDHDMCAGLGCWREAFFEFQSKARQRKAAVHILACERQLLG